MAFSVVQPLVVAPASSTELDDANFQLQRPQLRVAEPKVGVTSVVAGCGGSSIDAADAVAG